MQQHQIPWCADGVRFREEETPAVGGNVDQLRGEISVSPELRSNSGVGVPTLRLSPTAETRTANILPPFQKNISPLFAHRGADA